MALLLNRRINERIEIDGPCEFWFNKTKGKSARIAIQADRSVPVLRWELKENPLKPEWKGLRLRRTINQRVIVDGPSIITVIGIKYQEVQFLIQADIKTKILRAEIARKEGGK